MTSLNDYVGSREFIESLVLNGLVGKTILQRKYWHRNTYTNEDRIKYDTLDKFNFYTNKEKYSNGWRNCSPDLTCLNLYATVDLPSRQGCVGRIKRLADNNDCYRVVELEFDDEQRTVNQFGRRVQVSKTVFFDLYNVKLVDSTQCKYVYKTNLKNQEDLPPVKNRFSQTLDVGDFVIGSITRSMPDSSTTRGVFVAGVIKKRTKKQLHIEPYPGIVPNHLITKNGLVATQYFEELIKLPKEDIEQHLFRAALGS